MAERGGVVSPPYQTKIGVNRHFSTLTGKPKSSFFGGARVKGLAKRGVCSECGNLRVVRAELYDPITKRWLRFCGLPCYLTFELPDAQRQSAEED